MKSKRRLLLVASAVAVVLIALVVWVSGRRVQLYKVTVLPSLGRGFRRLGAINDRGQVAGCGYVGISNRYSLFIWDRDNGINDLSPIVDVDNFNINNASQIAGTMTDPNGNKQVFFWDPNDGMQMLGTFGGIESFAKSLNNRGQVVGFSHREKNRPEAFIWDKTNGMRSLTPNKRQYGRARAINDDGQVLGEMGTETDEFSPYPFLLPYYWDSTDQAVTRAMSASPDGYPGGFDINNNGYVLSTRSHRPTHRRWVCLWHKDTKIEQLFSGRQHISPIAFNDANQILYREVHSSPFTRFSIKHFPPFAVHSLWDPKRGEIVLDDQVPSEIGKLVDVLDINNRGCIIGTIHPKGSGRRTGVLLEPIPERWDE